MRKVLVGIRLFLLAMMNRRGYASHTGTLGRGRRQRAPWCSCLDNTKPAWESWALIILIRLLFSLSLAQPFPCSGVISFIVVLVVVVIVLVSVVSLRFKCRKNKESEGTCPDTRPGAEGSHAHEYPATLWISAGWDGGGRLGS